MEILVSTRLLVPPGDKTMLSLIWKVTLPTGHFELLIYTTEPIGKKKKRRGVVSMNGVVNPDYQGKIMLLYTKKAKRTMYGRQGIL